MDDPQGKPADDAGEYPIAPGQPDAPVYKPAIYPRAPADAFTPTEPEPKRFQFTLSELLGVMAMAAALLALRGLLPHSPRLYAGLMGLGVVISLVVAAVLKPARGVVDLAWWTLLMVYLMACVAAAIQSD